MFPTWMSNCYEPEKFGVAQYCVPALTYIAKDKWTHTGKLKLQATISLTMPGKIKNAPVGCVWIEFKADYTLNQRIGCMTQ